MNDSTNERTTPDGPDFPRLPPGMEGATDEELAERYNYLAGLKIAGETRAGCHPSGRNDPDDVEKDAGVREVLEAGLVSIVREMAAVHRELHERPGGIRALLPAH